MPSMGRSRTTICSLMNATVEPEEGNTVKITIEISEEELEPSIEHAWKHIAQEVRLPGFRPGKAPRKLLEKQVGSAYGRGEALKEAVPEFYSKAVIEHDVDVIAAPELEITNGEESGPVTVVATVEVRPEVEIAGYTGLRVEIPGLEASEDEINEQIDRLRSQSGELEEVDRASEDGDYVTVDIVGTQDGEEVEGLNVEDYMYLIGSGMIAPEFDENLIGLSADDEVEFSAQSPDPEGGEVDFHVTIKNVQTRVLPDLTDEWVAEETEFETVEELVEDTRNTLNEQRKTQARGRARHEVEHALVKLLDLEAPPEALVANEVQNRLQGMASQLSMQGISLEDYLRFTGRDVESFMGELRGAAEEGVMIDLALRAIVKAESIEADESDIDELITEMIGGADITLEAAKEQLRSAGQLSEVRSDVAKTKALDWVFEQTEVVDEDGNVIPAEALAEPEPSKEPENA